MYYCWTVAQFKCRAVFIFCSCHPVAILAMPVYSVGPFPHTVTQRPCRITDLAVYFSFWTITLISDRFFDIDTKIALRRRVQFVIATTAIMSILSCRPYRDAIPLRVTVVNWHAVCVIRVGFVALFRVALQPRKCAPQRVWFFNAVVVCPSSSNPSSPHNLHQ